jgi:hypothetical protein
MRPFPPELLIEEYVGIDYFVPAPELDLWVRNTFLRSSSPLFNEEHLHLLAAHIGYLWTNVPNVSKMRGVAGMAEYPFFRGSPWQKNRAIMQMQEWFGEVPNFVITLSAGYSIEASDTDFCALVEHELYHCAQKLDEFDQPLFNPATELPIFCMREHDVTEFVGVVRRYGIGAVANGRAFVAAANSEPEIEPADIAQMCGNCLR